MKAAVESLRFGYESVLGAPADYLAWLQLARSLATLGEWQDAWKCFEMAEKYSAPGLDLRLFR